PLVHSPSPVPTRRSSDLRDAVAVLLEPLARIDDRLVLGDRRDDVVALLAVHLGDALDRQIVRLGRAARDDNLLRVRPDEIGDLLDRKSTRLNSSHELISY